MKKTLIITLFFLGFNLFGQVVKIDTLKLPIRESVSDVQKDKINYPLIRTENVQIDSLINFDLKNKFTRNEYPKDNIYSTLYKWSSEGITFIDFEVSYNKNGIISLNISAEGCGAYCTGWTEYYNYSTITGKPIEISSIFDASSNFVKEIFKDKTAQFEKQRQELKSMLNDKKSELDTSTYEMALEYYNTCDSSFRIEKFELYSDHIKFICDCYLPHMILNLTPVINLEYKYSRIKKYLKLKL